MNVDVVLLPGLARPNRFAGRAVVVFDVLRASTTMIAALAAGVKEIRVFASLEAARNAAADFEGERILCGEERCLPPPGFDLGNSPCAFADGRYRDQVLFMSTTNGTRAIVAARQAELLLIGALTNAGAAADRLVDSQLNVTLLCAGTGGEVAMEDLLGAGAVIDSLLQRKPGVQLESDAACIAHTLFDACRHDLLGVLRQTLGGRNVMDARLPRDVDFAAQLHSSTTVPTVVSDPLRVIATGFKIDPPAEAS